MMQPNEAKLGLLGKVAALSRLAANAITAYAEPVFVPPSIANDPMAAKYLAAHAADESADRDMHFVKAVEADALAALQEAMAMPSLVEVAPPAPPAVPSAP